MTAKTAPTPAGSWLLVYNTVPSSHSG